jgi:hypothetical protein
LTLREEYRWKAFENRETSVSEREELHSEALQSLYSSPHIIRMIKSRRMRWAGHVTDEKCVQNLSEAKSEGRKEIIW